MPTIPEIITIAKGSQPLCANDVARKVYGGLGVDLLLPRKIYMVRKNVERIYGQDPDDETLPATANYLYALCGKYGLAAQHKNGTAGTIAAISTGEAPAQLNFTVAASGTTLVDGQSSVTLSSFIGFNLVVVKNGTGLTQITSAPVYYTWNKTTGLFTVSPAAFLGDEFQITAV